MVSGRKSPSREAPRKKNHASSMGPREPNIMVTIDERHRALAMKEIAHILDSVPGAKYRFSAEPGQGLIGIRIAGMDPRACIEKLHGVILQDPLAFQHTHRWMPIEAWAHAERRELARFAQMAGAEIGADESWKIEVDRHHSSLHRDLLVNSLAKEIPNRNVDLENPEKTILLAVVGEKAGMAVVKPSETLNARQTVDREFVRFEEIRD